MEFNSDNILNRIKKFDHKIKLAKPLRVFYSGPDYAEVAIYYGDTNVYKDIFEFWIAISTWVSMDTLEYDSLSWVTEDSIVYSDTIILNKNGSFPNNICICKEQDFSSEEITGILTKVKSLKQFKENAILKGAYKMSENWADTRYLLDFKDSYFLYNWYTGE